MPAINPDGTDVITDNSQSVMASGGSSNQHYQNTEESHTGKVVSRRTLLKV